MACCGKNTTTVGSATRSSIGSSRPSSPSTSPNTYFRCVGATGITAIGPISRRMYRFPSSGLLVEVDPRDAASLLRVPSLQQVRTR